MAHRAAGPHGVCLGVLSGVIEEGAASSTDFLGLPVAMAIRYSDDEPGSPWTWVLYLDARASRDQHDALEAIFTGRLGGDAERHFPWTWKASALIAVRRVEIAVDHTRRRQRLRIRDHVSVRIRDRYHGNETATCVIPGHQRPRRGAHRGSANRRGRPTRIQLPQRLRLRHHLRLLRLTNRPGLHRGKI
jgi:hypothetical protein